MTEAISFILKSLEPVYPAGETRSLSRIILSHITGLSSYQLLSCKDRELSMIEKKKLEEIIKRLKESEPIQYILGECEFYNLAFEVNPSTLIPRPETEELVEYILTDNKGKSLRILDIGTGSGCIAISLAKHLPDSNIEALDISPEALLTAKRNAEKNQVGIRFLQANVLNDKDHHILNKNGYDIIVSNPPYVTEREKEDMDKNVLNFEPHTALFVKDNDPLLFYRKIARIGKEYLKPEGILYFEINRVYGNETVELLEAEGYTDIIIKKDLYENDRIIKARR